MLLCWFESHLGLKSSGCSMRHFLKLVTRGFLWVLQFPPLLHRFNGSADKNKAQINAISTLSNLIAELPLRTMWHITWHVAHDKRSMCCMWFAHDCARATWAYVLEMVRGEEIVKNLELRLWMWLLLLYHYCQHSQQVSICTVKYIENAHPHCVHIEGFRPEWYISTIYHAWVTPFWSGTLNMLP